MSAARQKRPLDTITFGAQSPDETSGRNPDGSAQWATLRAPSKGFANARAGLDKPAFLPFIVKSAGC